MIAVITLFILPRRIAKYKKTSAGNAQMDLLFEI